MLAKSTINVETFASPEIVPDGESRPLFVVAELNRPSGIVFDLQGHLVVATSLGHQIIRIKMDGSYQILAGKSIPSTSRPKTCTTKEAEQVVGSSAIFKTPLGLALDPSGNIMVADSGNGCIRQIKEDGTVTTVRGKPGIGQNPNLARWNPSPTFTRPVSLCYHGTTLYVADQQIYTESVPASRVIRFTEDGKALSIGGEKVWDGVRWSAVEGDFETGTILDPAGICASLVDGSVYITQFGDHSIRVIKSNGRIEAYAGKIEGCLDGSRLQARFFCPSGIVMSPLNEIIVADRFNHKIRIITSNGMVSTIAGQDRAGLEDGVHAHFEHPAQLCFSPYGDLYITDEGSFNIRRIPQLIQLQLQERFSKTFNFENIPFEVLNLQLYTIPTKEIEFSVIVPLVNSVFPNSKDIQATLDRFCPKLSSIAVEALVRLVQGTIPLFDSPQLLPSAELIVRTNIY
jgi:DNA-binding beta-propeller fold protein YncE